MDYKSTTYQSKLQRKQLFLSRKLLELKKVARKNNYRMALDLDSLLPREYTGNLPSSPFDPSSSTEMLNLSELSAQSSLFGSDIGVGFDGSLQDLTSYDDPYFTESLYSDNREKLEKLTFDRQDQTQASGNFQHVWVTFVHVRIKIH